MTEKRIQFNNILQNQLPQYVREEFPLVAEFLKQYYISQEFQSASADIIQNIDQYLKLDTIGSNAEATTLTSNIDFLSDILEVTSTTGFPDTYGLLQIDNEIITYTGRTSNSFIGCVRGFSGTTSYTSENKPDQLLFKSSESADHSEGATVINLSSLFLKEFFNKIKYQITPGFENREFYSSLDKYLFLKQSKDFYSTRGTDLSFKILFNALYGEDVKIIRPQDYLSKPSGSLYEISNNLVVESISGDPYNLERSTLYQDAYGTITSGYASISKVEKIFTKSNKIYYKLSFDTGYNRDIGVNGSLYGNFTIHPKTKLIGNITQGTTTLDVDSTVGFPSSGELTVTYNDGTEGVISYGSKSLNQFFDCENISNSKTIFDGSDICLNVYAYGTSNKNSNETIKVRVTSVLNEIDIVNGSYYYDNGDLGIIKTLGVDPQNDPISNDWIFNISPIIEISSASSLNISGGNQTYQLTTKINHNLRVGDIVSISFTDSLVETFTVDNVTKSNIVQVTGRANLDLTKFYSIQRKILKVNSEKYSYLSNQTTDVQNIYKVEDRTLVASPSLPSYNKQQLNAFEKSASFDVAIGYIGDTFSSFNHGFYTGDSVYYIKGSVELFDEGIYFVKRIDSNNFKLAKSRENIYKSDKDPEFNGYIAVENLEQNSTDNKIVYYDFYSKQLTSQKLLREINRPVNDGQEYETVPGPVGIFINGVEILNYKSKDQIYYGTIEGIDVINPGIGYDIINPPTLQISDSVGTGATGYCSVRGFLQEIRIVDPGFDYLETPKINITGGNGIGAKANASMKLIDHQVSFNAESKSAFVNLTNNSIGFSTFHKFRNAERIVYRTNSQSAVGGISTNSSYYVSILDSYTVKLHNTFDDALVGLNTVSLTSYGIGNHILESYSKKSVIAKINIENNGSGYENKKRTVSFSGISTSLDYITIKGHDFKSGELVNYSTQGSPIGGLVNNSNYYITRINDDSFRLSSIGIGTDNQDFYYKTNQHIQFTSSGTGTHIFNYPQINVEIVGSVGVSSSFKAKVQPIFRGEIASVHLENSGVGYGSSEILNFNRTPNVSLTSGSEAQLIPIINNGKIVEILINNPGKDYNSPPNLLISTNGSGLGAVLTPVIENGQIKSVNIIESGAGYVTNNTFINVIPSGTRCQLKPKLKTWTVNLFSKYFNKITDDDGFIFNNTNSKYGLEYSHLYVPRKLRETVFSREIGGKVLYGVPDLIKSNNIEVSSTKHSPIIGWAYDGNPIYGPYGFDTKSGGSITRMKSGYTIVTNENRPPENVFPEGFFVEDFEYQNIDDDSILDEYNGRFCVTPEFPNGVYAYFATIDGESSNSFGGYRLPVFPYIIGKKFKSVPNDFNFKLTSNQDDIDLNETNWARNTTPYNLLKNYSSYPYLHLPNELNQTLNVKYASPGRVETVGIVTGGINYKVNDKVIFDEEGTGGFGFASKVSKIRGKKVNSISVASTTFYNAEIYPLEGNKNAFIVETISPHNLYNEDIITISGLNTSTSLIGGSYDINVTKNTLAISSPSGIGSDGATGIVTFISVAGNLNNSTIKENDIYLIGNERVKVLNVDTNSSRIRVLRSINGTVGSAHSYTDVLYEDPRRFTINVENSTSYGYKVNKEIYFNPKETLGLGTVFGVGIGTTLSFENPGVGITQIFIPSKSVYIPNHGLKTGDVLTYSTNSGDPISVSNNGTVSFTIADQTPIYVAKIDNDLIGISTVKVGLGSTGTFVGIASTTSSLSTLYFTGIGTGTYHSFKTNYSKLTGKVSKNIVTVSTAETHGLTNNDYVLINVNPGISTTIEVKYDDYNRKLIVNPRSFVSGNIDISSNTILIPNHKFETGQKIIHTSNSPSGGLVNNKVYYVVVFDKNTIKLSTSYFGATNIVPEIVDITSASSGTISPVNPPIKVYKDSTVIFDLSDLSLSYVNESVRYSAFEFNLYIDSDYTQIFDKSTNNKTFEVTRFGRIGIDSTAKVALNATDQIPQKLYYKLDPVYSGNLPTIKEEINIDSSVNLNNEIQVVYSEYNGNHRVTSVSSTSFTYNLEKDPEALSYTSPSFLDYETTSSTAFGAVSKIDVISKGQQYSSIPKFKNISSSHGSGAILEAYSKSIGNIQKTKLNNIGFDFSCDFTVRPNISLSQILKIEPLNSIEYIGITSTGRGYSTAPKLIIVDGKTKEVLSEVDLTYSLGDTFVTVLNNTYRLNDIDPIIIPTQNSNGVGISSITYNSLTKDVTVDLSVGFSTASAFPFAVNDKILIENISIGIGSDAKGFNSSEYEYQLFTITSIDANIGGTGSVTYNLGEFLEDGETPGTYDTVNSSGRIIPEKYFPKFNVLLSPNNFFKNENVRYPDQTNTFGFVESWNEKTKYLKVSSREVLKVGNIIEGASSKTQGIISFSFGSYGFINLNAYSKLEDGWSTETGILNNNLQRIQDNFYYQNFSYSLKSKVPYSTWENAVGSLNHTAGFKKFSDYQLESFAYSGISTDTVSVLDATADLYNVASLNCVYDFDLAKENALVIGPSTYSDEITFSSRVLTDYFESVGNRVLSIDNISNQFNSNARSTRYSIVHRFPLSSGRSQKYITYVRDRRYTNQRQILLFTLLQDNTTGYLNQYGRVESLSDLGSFDFTIDGTDGLILFYPIKYRVNNYDVTTLSYNLKDTFSGVGTTTLGDIATLDAKTVNVPLSTPTTVISIGNTYTSSKVLVEISTVDQKYQFDELSLVHDGTNIELLEYGQLTNHSTDSFSSSGLGTYYPYFSGSNLNVDFIPNPGIAASVSTFQISIANTSVSGVGTFDLRYARLEARSTSIASTSSPTETVIAEYPNSYDGGYYLVQVSDTTNNIHQLSEVIVLDDEDNSYITEFGNIETQSGIGTIGSTKTANTTRLTFTPLPDIDVEVKVYFNSLTNYDETNEITEYNNGTIVSDYNIYVGTERDVRLSFELKHQGNPIFRRYFDGSSPSVVSIASSTIRIQNHFFVTGEKVSYSIGNSTTSAPIGIASTDFGVGIGTTNKLPSSVYIIKIDENTIKLARSAEDALKTVPNALSITSVGIGTSHVFTSINQNAKALIAIDNLIQSPVVATSTTTQLSANLLTIQDLLYSNSTADFSAGDLIRIDNEIMTIEAVGVGSTNAVRVLRPTLGTEIETHSIGSSITKLAGNYNIVDNILNFATAPYGNVPIGTSTNPPDERDWIGITSSSSFHGRTFMRSGITDSSNESYYRNYLFDDISSKFNGSEDTFTITSNGSNITEVFEENAIVLINDIFQEPGIVNNYTLIESVGITSISFVGSATSQSSDINTSNLPSGGIIVSVGSTKGFGYQPLVSAGGTAIVSAAGTISSISIGNSGSGYRSFIQTPSGISTVNVRVGVATSSTGIPNIQFIGTAAVSNGNIVSVAITNPGVGYTSSNPPYVIIDAPLSYSDIPLIYSSSSSGIGTMATVDIVVGQGSSIINFDLKNTGYGYSVGDILTVPIGGATGIPTTPNSTLQEFKISIESVDSDRFSGWSIGELEVFDNIQSLFDGKRVIFPLSYNGTITSVYAKKGSLINIQDVLLVFVNDIIQIPGEGYIFGGGSKIQFTEAPKPDDTCKILFYKGSGDDVDVIFRDVIETVKIGDDLQLTYDSFVGQSASLLENERRVSDILSIETVETNPYFGPGNTADTTLVRPINWCRQTEDVVINENEVAKSREFYEPLIFPTTYLIQPVGVGSTVLYVENIRPLFNSTNEAKVSLDFQNNITFISQDPKVGASATAIVSISSTISSIDITNGGSGYISSPNVIIQNPIGVGDTTATAIASITSGIVTSININLSIGGYSQENPPSVLIEPPATQIESSKVISYEGDFGIISGISTVSVGVASTGIVFDFLIPKNSPLREGLISGITTVSGIQTGYYFMISDSNVGYGITTLDSYGQVVGSGSSFLDAVYQVAAVSIAQTSVIGYGVTYVAKVTTSVSNYNGLVGIGFSNNYGNFSWGRILLKSRKLETSYSSYSSSGYSGISTGTIISRTEPLKYVNYKLT